MEGTARPDYKACVAISTNASLSEMIPPGALVMLTPVIVGTLFGVQVCACTPPPGPDPVPPTSRDFTSGDVQCAQYAGCGGRARPAILESPTLAHACAKSACRHRQRLCPHKVPRLPAHPSLPQALAGVLAGALVSGVQLAVSMSNTGGAWDNAKKVREGAHIGRTLAQVWPLGTLGLDPLGLPASWLSVLWGAWRSPDSCCDCRGGPDCFASRLAPFACPKPAAEDSCCVVQALCCHAPLPRCSTLRLATLSTRATWAARAPMRTRLPSRVTRCVLVGTRATLPSGCVGEGARPCLQQQLAFGAVAVTSTGEPTVELLTHVWYLLVP